MTCNVLIILCSSCDPNRIQFVKRKSTPNAGTLNSHPSLSWLTAQYDLRKSQGINTTPQTKNDLHALCFVLMQCCVFSLRERPALRARQEMRVQAKQQLHEV